MNQVLSGRVLMGDSLGFHIIFALLGVGLPLVVAIFEAMGLRRRDAELLRYAKLWSYIAGVLVITGVLSGTVVALQMFLIWPGILQFGGKAISLAFAWEGYAFILEAVFLGFYLKTWDKLKGWAHWALIVPVGFGAALSAFLITSVDAWMNHPLGITVVGGQVVRADPIGSIFTTTTYLEAGHSILSYYLVAILLAAAILAIRLLRRQAAGAKLAAVKLALGRCILAAVLLVVGIVVLGDMSARYLAANEPTKLAAIEDLGVTTRNAPFRFGNWEVPGLLSWLAGGDTNAKIQGLDQAKAGRPPAAVHGLFNLKLVAIAALSAIVLGFAGLYAARSKLAFSRPVLWAIVTAPLVSLLVVELGWMVTELGRQPYSVAGYVLTKDAFTSSAGVVALSWLFPAAYLVLGAVTLGAVWRVVQTLKAGAK